MCKKTKDEELVRGFLAGDELCFERLFQIHRQKVYNLALRMVRNQTDAEDLVQEIFLQVFRKLNSFKFECQFSTWLYRVASNFSLMKIRSDKRKGWVFFDDWDCHFLENIVEDRSETSDIHHMSCGHEVRGMLNAAVINLPEHCRNVYVLKDVDGLPLREICQELDISESVFKNRLHRARTLMRKAAREYIDEGLEDAA